MRVHDPDRRNLLEGKVALVTGGGGSLGLAVAMACKHALPAMADSGAVVIVSGVAAPRGEAGKVAAAAAEHAQVGLMRALATEMAGRGIRVNTVHPGPFANGGHRADPRILLGRPPQPDEVARSVLYLASPMSSFTTASTLVVDGD